MVLCLLAAVIAFAYFTRYKPFPKLNGLYSQQADAWSHVKYVLLAILLGLNKLYRKYLRRQHPKDELKQFNLNKKPSQNHANSLRFFTSDKHGNVISVLLNRHFNNIAEADLTIRLSDGRLLTHHLEPSSLTADETPVDDDEDQGYISAGGIRIRAIDPVRTYRIIYSGLMKLKTEASDEKYVEVNVRLWFLALTDPSNPAIDYNSCLVAKNLSVEPGSFSKMWAFINLPRVKNQQSGEMRGVVEVAGERQEVTLHGVREYTTGPWSVSNLQGFFVLFARFDNGIVLTLHVSSMKNFVTHDVSGIVYYPTGYVYPVAWSDFHLSHMPRSGNIQKNLVVNVAAHGKVFSLDLEVLDTKVFRCNGNANEAVALLSYENVVKVTLNGEMAGFGLAAFNNQGQRTESAFPTLANNKVLVRDLTTPVCPVSVPQCLQLSNPLCRIGSITGGKAAKLADIVAVVSKQDPSAVDMKVPDGFAITVSAYENHIREHPELAKFVHEVLDLANQLSRNNDEAKSAKFTADLEAACQRLHDAFIASTLTQSLQDDIIAHLKTTFGDNWSHAFTAVRSSAVGEDGTEASGAGQMETFLGERGKDKIFHAVKMCWASHFAFRAIQYRRQLCAKLDSPMAVLVQDLVKADVAGVLFTRHPDTGSTTQSVINACFGIGEGVVSGHVQPDTISVYKTEPTGEEIRIAYDVLGEKATAYRLDEEKGVVEEESISSVELDSDDRCCMSKSEIRRLYDAGRLIEKIFGAGRDVEFALKKDAATGKSTILILQARPITTADMEQEWELLQEFDTPVASDNEWVTTANVQEMMPGALAPLSAACWMEPMKVAMERAQTDIFIKPRRRFSIPRLMKMYRQHVFINWTLVGSGMTSEFNKISGDMALFGRRMDELKFEMFVEQNDMACKMWQYYEQAFAWKHRLFPKNGMTRLTSTIDGFRTPAATDPVELFKQSQEALELLKETWYEHIRVSTMATMYPMIIMNTLDSTLNWGPQIYEDMATLLSSCTDVFSADVPTQLQVIAAEIKADPKNRDAFLEMSRTEAAKWLLSEEWKGNNGLFKKFLDKHGHRCVRDSDLREKSWNEEPEKVIDALKVMISSNAPGPSVHSDKRVLSIEEALDAIKTPIGTIQRMVIKHFLPKAREAVGLREWAKSYGIKQTDNLRRIFARLAVVLTERGHLPDSDLLFFLSPDELETLLVRRSPKLIAKALRRRRLFPKFSTFQFPELINGHPEPLKVERPAAKSDGEKFTIKGMAVGYGCIEGDARVVKSLADANQIQTGDILIVPYTDVGWTPYFPMISGLVTELGGLISHGAVVAREYGLPCLVGCKQATDLIKTGDRVFINGHAGQIEVEVSSS